MPIIYKNTDSAAPLLTGAAGSLIDLLKACLVNGYGIKTPAGWGYEDVHVATKQALFSQGVMPGRVIKKLYVKDDASTVGVATAWMCTDCTKVSSPVFTENFWGGGSTYNGVLTKADQENAGASAWMLVADSRSAILLTKRSEWAGAGWAFSFFGDMASGMQVDKGCCAAAGWNSYDTIPAYGTPCRAPTNAAIGVFGDIDGTFAYTGYTMRNALGYASSVADNLYPVNRYNRETHIARAIAADGNRYRGHIPFVWWPVAPALNFPWGAVAEGAEVMDPTGTLTFLHIQFGMVSGMRAFIELSGF